MLEWKALLRSEKVTVILSLLFLASLTPAFFQHFGFHNDYSYLGYPNRHRFWTGYPETQHLIEIGRPLGAALLNAHAYIFNFKTVEKFLLARLFSALFAAATFVYLGYLFRLARKSRSDEAIVFLSALLPPIALYVVWVTNFIPGLFNIALALTAWHACYQGSMEQAKKAKVIWLILSFVTMVASHLIYPPTAFAFLIPALWYLYVAQDGKHPLRVGLYSALIATISFGVVGLYIMSRTGVRQHVGVYDISLSYSLIEKYNNFRHQILPNSAPLWFSADRDFLWKMLSISSAIGFVTQPFLTSKRPLLGFLKLTLAVGLLILTLSPFIIPKGNTSAFRTLWPFMAILLLSAYFLVAFLLNRIRGKYLSTVILIAVATFAFCCNLRLVHTIASRASTEIESLRDLFLSTAPLLPLNQTSELIIFGSGNTPDVLKADLNLSGTDFSSPIENLFFLVTRNTAWSEMNFAIGIVNAELPIDWIPSQAEMWTKDLLTSEIRRGKPNLKKHGTISTQGTERYRNSLLNLFDKQRPSFVEFYKVNLMTITLNFPQPTDINRLNICPDFSAPERLPKTVTIPDAIANLIPEGETNDCMTFKVVLEGQISQLSLTLTPADPDTPIRIGEISLE